MKITIDFEIRSRADLQKVGAWKYASDPSTEVLCVAWAVASEPVRITVVPLHSSLSEQWRLAVLAVYDAGLPLVAPFELMRALRDADEVEAHNASFERAIYEKVLRGRRLWDQPWPDIPLRKWRCSAAIAAQHCLPRDLQRAAQVVGCKAQKDKDGHALMLRWCKPRRPSKANPKEWEDDPAEFVKLCAYCIADVEAERELGTKLRPLPPEELAIWQLDRGVNEKGLALDVETIKAMIELIAVQRERLGQEFSQITGGEPASPTQVIALLGWLEARGVAMDCLDKHAIEAALQRTDLPPECRRALEIRQITASASVKKFQAMLEGAEDDHRVRETSVYHGASTGRDTGVRLQPLNFPRGVLEPHEVEDAIAAFQRRDPEWLELMYGGPIQAGVSCLRSVIWAPPGFELIAADYSAIEGRVLAWVAGEDWLVEAYRGGQDAYKIAAMPIFGKAYEDITKEERQVGKPSDLAFGYGGGINAYNTMRLGYGVDLGLLYGVLTKKCDESMMKRAAFMAARYVEENPGELTFEEAVGADLAKQLWRQDHPRTVAFWHAAEQAAIDAVRQPGTVTGFRGIRFACKGEEWLYARLPSGRLLHYPLPRLRERANKFDPTKPPKTELTYMHINSKTKQWQRTNTYGGKLAENFVQAISRDFFYHGAFAVTRAGYPLVLRVYDELVAEVPEGFGSVEEFCQLMAQVPAWGRGCPVVAEGWRGIRYRKD